MTATIRTKTALKLFFETGDKPTQSEFDDLITTLRAREEDIVLNADSIELDPTPATDDTGSGLVITDTVGETVVFAEALYRKSDGKLWKSNAASSTTSPVSAMAMANVSADATGSVMLQGVVRNDSWAWTPGALIYANNAAGEVTAISPSGTTGNQIQVVGHAISADVIYFNPDLTTVEIA